MQLNEIRDNDGARYKYKRIGRGIGCGKGKTGGRGGKGQTARSGVAIGGFEGGQMPLYRRLPKRGFVNHFRKNFVVLNVQDIEDLIEAKKIDATQPITIESLLAAGVIKQALDGLKILGIGTITQKVSIVAVGASKTAQAALEKVGATLTLEPYKSLKKAVAPAS